MDPLNELDPEAVSEGSFKSGGSFAGLFAGEHVAATGFVIGALFVSHGVTARDLLPGLLLRNLLAVLSWTLVCAPIAVRTRLTFYLYLRRTGGPGFMLVHHFAWFCNLPMHIGLPAWPCSGTRRSRGMANSRRLASIRGIGLPRCAAGIMVAAAGRSMAPGRMAYVAIGAAGVFAVLPAGWTPANPTLWRAGLALQSVTPDWPRWKIALWTGVLTTVLSRFPLFFMKLLDSVAIYGLILMPGGAVVFAEHWILARPGWKPKQPSGE
jgi:purine-cytosine permease-like protein